MSFTLENRNTSADSHLATTNSVPDARFIANEDGSMPEPAMYEVSERSDGEIADGQDFAASRGLETRLVEDLDMPAAGITEASVMRLKDISATNDAVDTLKSLGMDDKTARLFTQFGRYGTPGVITIVHDQSHGLGTLAPILDPDELRVITSQLIAEAVDSLGDDKPLMSRLLGTTAIMHQRIEGVNGSMRSVPALNEGVLDLNMTNFRGREVTKDQSDVVYVHGNQQVVAARSGKLQKAVLAQAALYPVIETDVRNEEALVIALKGKQITPAAVTAIAREMGIEGPMGMLLAAEGTVNLSAIHSLPERPIDRVDMGRLMLRHSVDRVVGAGTASHSEPYSRNGHIHTDRGHFLDASGTVWAMVYPADRENIVQYV